MIWFTSDTHFSHYNIIKYCDRPYSWEEHDEVLIENWNSVVGKKDRVFHLGDFGFGSPDKLYKNVACRLNGKITLIRGSHDKNVKHPLSTRFRDIFIVHFLKDRKKEIFLSHHSHRVWPKSYHGSLHLYGHSHGRLPPYGASMDVGVDCNEFKPISFDYVVEKLTPLVFDRTEKRRE